MPGRKGQKLVVSYYRIFCASHVLLFTISILVCHQNAPKVTRVRPFLASVSLHCYIIPPKSHLVFLKHVVINTNRLKCCSCESLPLNLHLLVANLHRSSSLTLEGDGVFLFLFHLHQLRQKLL